MAVKVAANSFHRAAYFERIQDNLFHQYVLETLSAPPSFNVWMDFGTGQAVNLADAAVGLEEQGPSQGRPAVPGYTGSEQQGEGNGSTRYGGLQTSKVRTSNGSSVPTAPARQTSVTTTAAPIIARSPIPFQQDKLQELTSEVLSSLSWHRLVQSHASTEQLISGSRCRQCQLGH